MKKYNLFGILVTAVMMVVGCSEQVDVSSRYVFKEETLVSYMEKHADAYSEYLDVLKNTPISEISQSSIYQMLTARGNYTVFAPTNDAIQKYLEDLCEEGLITEPTWEGFPTTALLDSIRMIIA